MASSMTSALGATMTLTSALLLLLATTAWCGPAAGPAPTKDCKATYGPAPTPKPGVKTPYTTKYDNINVDMILRNERLLKNYIDCLMDRKPCSREGQLLKEIIPDALQSECSRCSDKQKQIAGHIMSYLLQERKQYWDELLCKYDPEGNFRRKYEVDEDEDDDEEDRK